MTKGAKYAFATLAACTILGVTASCTTSEQPTIAEPNLSNVINALPYDEKILTPVWRRACFRAASDFFLTFHRDLFFGILSESSYSEIAINFRNLANGTKPAYRQMDHIISEAANKIPPTNEDSCANFSKDYMLTYKNGFMY